MAYGAWTALSLRARLTAANTDAHNLRAALLGRDQQAAQRSFTALADDLHAARSRAHSPAWWVVERLPFVGDDSRAIGTAADVGGDLVDGSLSRLVSDGDWRLADRLTPHHGRVDLAAVESLAPTVEQTAADFAQARQQLGSVHAAALSGWVRPGFTKARDQVDQVASTLGVADRAFRVLPVMLGADGPKTYLLAFNNNAEIRATGGIPSALALVSADQGRIRMVRQASSSEFPELPEPVLPQTSVERAIYDINPTVFLQDTNFTPEFPRTAQLMSAMWTKRFGGHLDGVISVDAVTLSYLLQATGPIHVGGVELTSTNATQEILNRVYERLPDNLQQDAFFRDVAKQTFASVMDGAAPPKLLTAVARGVDEGRIYLRSFDAPVQRILEPSAIAGNLHFKASRNPRLGVYLDDATGAKMSYYLRTHLTVRSQRCVGGRQTLSASMVLHSTAPTDASKLPHAITGGGAFGTEPGHLLLLGHIYGPSGGGMSDFRFDGHPTEVPSADDRSRPVATTVIDLGPGQTTHVTWQVTTGPDQPGSIQLEQGPEMASRSARSIVLSSCR